MKRIIGLVICLCCLLMTLPVTTVQAEMSYEEAKASYDNAVWLESQGAVGFYKNTYGFTDDMINSVLDDKINGAIHVGETYRTYTNIGADNDATSLYNLKRAIGLLRVYQNLRSTNGLAMPNISIYEMLYAEVSANFNSYLWENEQAISHPFTPFAENIAVGYTYNVDDPNAIGPYQAWYYDEKAIYDSGRFGVTGHYENIVDPSYTSTGLGYAGGNSYVDVASAQEFNFLYRDGDVEVSYEQFVNDFNDYLASIEAAKQAYYEFVTPMYRLYNPNSGEHFYTSNTDERDHLASLGWTYEGIGWNAPKISDFPVYRLYNPVGGEHHYTLSIDEKNNLVRLGWKDEGIGWYSADSSSSESIPVKREYNPNAFANNHNYTISLDEHNWLVGLGWKDEGTGWFALK